MLSRQIKFYSERQLLERLADISRTTLWRMVKRGDFPKPVRISPGRKGYETEKSDAKIAALADGPENGENEEATDAAS